uniref:Olduvai domain-containing protein n=1 Tax=Monodelphis domestica TaxID=13616 RepID=A0A5F8G8V1_MONDO
KSIKPFTCGPTHQLRSQLEQCRQRYQDLQEKLLVSEATVQVQANQLEQYRAQLPKSQVEGKLAEELRSQKALFSLLFSILHPLHIRKYDSLIQAQARELSHLRQKIREGRGVCHILSQHLRDTVKSFEDLLRGTDIDYYLGQSFREQLAQGSQLAERLTNKLNTSKSSHGPLQELLSPLHPTPSQCRCASWIDFFFFWYLLGSARFLYL